jgi:subtilisin
MSLGLRGFKDSFLPLMQAIRNRGILPVIAVGNEGPSTSRSPGNYDEVLSVGATSEANEVAEFSSSQKVLQPKSRIVPDLVAPGVGILSCDVGGGFRLNSGSSMATPHVTGLAALLWQAKPDATVEQIEQAIFTSCQRPPTIKEERGNRGIPDAARALDALMAGTATTVPVKKVVKKATKKKAASKKAGKKSSKKKS